MWFALASIGARNPANALAVLAWGRAASSFGLLCGATFGHWSNAVPDSLGISSLLRQPEFSDAKALLPVMEVLEDDRVLFHAFDDAVGEDGPIMVRIGHENPTSELAGVSIVACPYGRGRSEGVVAVIGPTRMNYQNAIRAVRAAQSVLCDD